jgi:(2S)-methylsuccinyl-CoA dehydrogenase
VSVLGRLQGIYIAMEVDAQPLHQLAASDDFRRLRRDAAGPEVLAKLGSAVANANGEIADVAVDDETAMARDAFRRFAQEVVAPMAEKIHRHDLTVPESLLQPMREMGVFGLSIPEEYSGNSPTGHENTPMIAVTEALSEASLAAAGASRGRRFWPGPLAGGTEDKRPIGCRSSRPAIRCARSPLPNGLWLRRRGLSREPHGRRLAAQRRQTWCTFAGKAGC